MKIDPASVHRLLTGKRPMRMDEAARIAGLLHVSVADVLEHAGLDVKAHRLVPLAGFVDGDGQARLQCGGVAELVPAPVDLPAGAVAVQLRTAASALDSMDGWTLYAAQPDGISPEAIGRLCLVGFDGRALLRFVRRGYHAGRFNLVHPGLGELHDAALEWATPVVHITP